MYKKFKKIFAIVGGIVVGITALVVGTRELIHSRQLAARGQLTQGEVVNLEDRTTYNRRSHTYYIWIKFQTENQIVREEKANVSEALFDATRMGETIPVHYLAEDPSICQVGPTVELRYGYILFGVFMLFAAVYLTMNFNRPMDTTEVADNINKSFKTLCVQEYEYRSVKAENFRHLDRAFYNATQQNLESRGFVFIDDQENVTLRQRSGIHTFIRCLLSADRTIMGSIYHFVPKFTLRVMGAKSAKVLDLETWCTDGSFVCTNNAEMAGKFNSPPEISTLHMSAGTAWDTLLKIHERRVNEHLASRPGTAGIALNGLADIRRAQAEMQRIKSEFRTREGLSKKELERMGGGPSPAIDNLHETLVERRARS